MSFQNCMLSPGATYKFHVENVHVSKNVYKGPSNPILIEMLQLNISLAEKLSKRQKIFFQTIMHNGNLDENYLPTRARQS